MAVLPDYVSGTITLANGSTTVTGTGTMFQVAAFKPGDTLQIQNLTAIIASVNSNTSLTLTSPWTGTSLTNAPYRARYLPDGARVTAQTTTLIELLGNGVLSSLAEIGVEEGKVPVGNAAGEYELVDTDEFGVQDPNGSLAKLAALSLAARQILQTDETGALKALSLAANKALVTDANKDVQQIDLGTLGRALLALATGTNAQYVRGDGNLATLNSSAVGLGNVNNTSDAAKPVSTATQTALNGKVSTSGGTLSGNINVVAAWPGIDLRGTGTTAGYLDFTPNGYSEDFTWRITTAQARWDFVIEYGGGDGYSNGQKFKVNRNGDVQVFGNLAKSSGTFLIDHPNEPLNKNLRHGFVEAPEYVNIYRGVVDLENGRMAVDIDATFGMSEGTFAALNVEVCVFLQTQYGPERVWLEGPADSGKFTIISENPQSSAAVAFMVTGRRNDPYVVHLDPTCERGTGRFIPEFDKPSEGKYGDANGNKADY